MKKNFLAIAAVLIAAMLMVVSCSQEVAPKTEDNGLVDARLNIAYGRDLIVTDDSKAEDFYLEYTTEYQWTNGNSEVGYTEGVEGAKTAELKPDGKLGWLTPGYWKVTVKAYEKDATSENGKRGDAIFEGTTSAYFTSKASTATIFLEPVTSDNNSIAFNFTMQNLGEYGTDFVVKYSISMNGNNLVSDQEFVTGEITNNKATDGSNNQSVYAKTVNVINGKKLASGYYTVTVSVYEVKNGDETLKGGISKGMLLAGNSATVSGHIEPSDYVIGEVKTYFVDVDTRIERVGTGFTLSNDNKKATINLKFVDNTNVSKYSDDLVISDFDRTYVWTVDGSDVKYTFQNANDVTIGTAKEVNIPDFTAPGVKNITCRTIYSRQVGTTTYYWADTQSIQVKVTDIAF